MNLAYKLPSIEKCNTQSKIEKYRALRFTMVTSNNFLMYYKNKNQHFNIQIKKKLYMDNSIKEGITIIIILDRL